LLIDANYIGKNKTASDIFPLGKQASVEAGSDSLQCFEALLACPKLKVSDNILYV